MHGMDKCLNKVGYDGVLHGRARAQNAWHVRPAFSRVDVPPTIHESANEADDVQLGELEEEELCQIFSSA